MTKSCDARGGVSACDSVQFSPYYLIPEPAKSPRSQYFPERLPCARHSGKYLAFILSRDLGIRPLQEIRFLSPVRRPGVRVSRPLVTCPGHKAGVGHRWHSHMGTWLQGPRPPSCWCHPEGSAQRSTLVTSWYNQDQISGRSMGTSGPPTVMRPTGPAAPGKCVHCAA